MDYNWRSPSRCQRMRHALHQSARHRELYSTVLCSLCRRCSSDCGSSKHHSHGCFLLFDGDVDQQWPWMRRVGHVWLRSGCWRRILFRTQVNQCCSYTVQILPVRTGPCCKEISSGVQTPERYCDIHKLTNAVHVQYMVRLFERVLPCFKELRA